MLARSYIAGTGMSARRSLSRRRHPRAAKDQHSTRKHTPARFNHRPRHKPHAPLYSSNHRPRHKPHAPLYSSSRTPVHSAQLYASTPIRLPPCCSGPAAGSMRRSHHAYRMLHRRLTVHMHACALQAAYPCADRRHVDSYGNSGKTPRKIDTLNL